MGPRKVDKNTGLCCSPTSLLCCSPYVLPLGTVYRAANQCSDLIKTGASLSQSYCNAEEELFLNNFAKFINLQNTFGYPRTWANGLSLTNHH